MHVSDRILTSILGKPSTGDVDKTLKALAQEIRLLRVERQQLRQVFKPFVGEDDPRIVAFFGAFQDLCMAHQLAAACVIGYDVDGKPSLRYAGANVIVTALMQALGADDHG